MSVGIELTLYVTLSLLDYLDWLVNVIVKLFRILCSGKAERSL